MLTKLSDIDRLFGNMGLLRNRLNSLYSTLDPSYEPGYQLSIEEQVPRTSLYEDSDHFEILAEVPGLRKEELNVKIQGNYLEISGARRADIPEGYKVHKTERGTGSFSRSFTLPVDVDAEKVEAFLKNGLLRMTLPKSEEAKPKKIIIN